MAPITEVEGRRIALSNLDKVLYPATGFTKGELLHYYATTAGVLLAHLYNRPVSFLRFPDGVDGEPFFAKNVPPGTPSWVKTAEVPRSDGPARQILVQDLPTLMWAANLVTEFHTPQWQADSPGMADRLVFDLDPGAPADVVACCEVALWLRERLAADELHARVKTSGSKGLHLLVPLVPTPSERVSAYAKELARQAEADRPDLVVHRMTRSLRPGKVFVDHSQNSAKKTTAAPYTVRARTEPTVSTPVTWEEVERCEHARDLVFLAGDIAGRLARYGDLMGPLINLNRAGRLPS
ncbi:non-homologous end-joining DNA ligase [Streptomyces beihaiensis]|uniref:Non-homologous end-joining DNA ligase n=1 Tax=Streptomyces beihaiensis TaxID=2984495 RepID=A0ABT3U459_9ACTN|nr:non-homologous end-joining DNA ligase [Streptomyces beihaiensis]MCX3064064.1 non-homologous end-joining DNA ligase [Streptomyces beihaiensis]